jgi:hypothetical protein
MSMAKHSFKASVREMSIERALRWAFAEECAQIEFDELGETAHGNRRGIDGIAIMIERGAIGCSIDGGGRSEPAWDAQVIASAVTNLPFRFGGKGMAVQVAAHARAGSRPDWIKDDRTRCVPRDWRMTKHGPFAKTELVGVEITTHRGRKSYHDIYACPVRFTPTAQQISSARRAYRDWWLAMLALAVQLRHLGILSQVRITQELPPRTPWLRKSLTEPQHLDRLQVANGTSGGATPAANGLPNIRSAS